MSRWKSTLNKYMYIIIKEKKKVIELITASGALD
jgi:hypothetical protein